MVELRALLSRQFIRPLQRRSTPDLKRGLELMPCRRCRDEAKMFEPDRVTARSTPHSGRTGARFELLSAVLMKNFSSPLVSAVSFFTGAPNRYAEAELTGNPCNGNRDPARINLSRIRHFPLQAPSTYDLLLRCYRQLPICPGS